MESIKLDAVFFSLHKIGGPQNYGVMVINSNSRTPFKPLIAGTQQHKLRGGTLNLSPLITAERYLKIKTLNTKLLWKHAVNILKTNNINVIEPTLEHLHNTILIKLDTCPLGIINKLSKDKIYVGAISACSNEEAVAKSIKEGYLRISFTDEKQLSDKILQEIIKTIKDEQAFRLGGGYAEDDLHPDAPEHGDRFEDDVDPDMPSDFLEEEDGEEDKNEIGLDFM
jgi:cysteine sulfinate desulfinase/cysteine desulfurase-like protein